MNKQLFCVLSIVLILGCAPTVPETETSGTGSASTFDWKSAPFTDIATGETFRISDFAGKPVLVESFAVWCPICLKQQKEMQKQRAQNTNVVHVSLDTDPNEDTAKVKEHIDLNKLNWYFAVAPEEVTRALIHEFGVVVVHAPGAPVILVCADQNSRLLPGGVKDAEELTAEIEKGC